MLSPSLRKTKTLIWTFAVSLFFKKYKKKKINCLNHCWALTPSTCIPVTVRDLGMVPYIKIFLDEDQYRAATLSILEQLAEINSDEFMSTAIGALCSSTQQELGLKRDLLQVRAGRAAGLPCSPHSAFNC